MNNFQFPHFNFAHIYLCEIFCDNMLLVVSITFLYPQCSVNFQIIHKYFFIAEKCITRANFCLKYIKKYQKFSVFSAINNLMCNLYVSWCILAHENIKYLEYFCKLQHLCITKNDIENSKFLNCFLILLTLFSKCNFITSKCNFATLSLFNSCFNNLING